LGKSVGNHTVLVFKEVSFKGTFWRIFPPGTGQTSGSASTMSVPSLGVVYHSDGKGQVTVIVEDPTGKNITYFFDVTSDEVYIDRDVIHIPALGKTRQHA